MHIAVKFKYIHDNELLTPLLNRIQKLSANAINMNYPIYRNKRLSIDDANVALGAITLGSE